MRLLRVGLLVSCLGLSTFALRAAEPVKVPPAAKAVTTTKPVASVPTPPVVKPTPGLTNVPGASPQLRDAAKLTPAVPGVGADRGNFGQVPAGSNSWLKPGGGASGTGEREFNPSGVLPNGGRNQRTDHYSKDGSVAAPSLGSIRSGLAKDGPPVGASGDYRTSDTSRGSWHGTSTRRTGEDGTTVSVETTMNGPGGQREHFAETRSDRDKDGYAETIESRTIEYSNGDGKSHREQTTRNPDGTYTTTVHTEPGRAPTGGRTTTDTPPEPARLGHIKTGSGGAAGGRGGEGGEGGEAGCVDPYSTHGGKPFTSTGVKGKGPAVVEAVQSGFGKQVRPDDTPPNETPRIRSQGPGTVINPGPVDAVRGGSSPGPTGARMPDQGKLVNPGRDPRHGSEKK